MTAKPRSQSRLTRSLKNVSRSCADFEATEICSRRSGSFEKSTSFCSPRVASGEAFQTRNFAVRTGTRRSATRPMPGAALWLHVLDQYRPDIQENSRNISRVRLLHDGALEPISNQSRRRDRWSASGCLSFDDSQIHSHRLFRSAMPYLRTIQGGITSHNAGMKPCLRSAVIRIDLQNAVSPMRKKVGHRIYRTTMQRFAWS